VWKRDDFFEIGCSRGNVAQVARDDTSLIKVARGRRPASNTEVYSQSVLLNVPVCFLECDSVSLSLFESRSNLVETERHFLFLPHCKKLDNLILERTAFAVISLEDGHHSFRVSYGFNWP
jgi:hypothetical protein